MTYKEGRPWGTFEIINESDSYKVKKITVHPGKRLSLQSHEKRSEYWIIISGNGVLTQDNIQKVVSKNSQVFIPVKQKHRIHNTGTEPLIFIEVQTGTYFGEDDIIRYDDDYNRT
jgi:mannose-6-phosphate isomerase-like protein (cupin superfamily)